MIKKREVGISKRKMHVRILHYVRLPPNTLENFW